MSETQDIDYSQFTNFNDNVNKVARMDQIHVMTNFAGKVLDYDARNGEITNKIINDSWLIDANQYNLAADAKARGDYEGYARLMETARSPLYKDLLVQAAKEEARIERAGYIPPSQILVGRTAAAAGEVDGQVLQTAHEIVRQTKYQQKVSGVFYRTEKYQAVNLVNKISTNDLTTKGATDETLPEGHPEIGDDQTPESARLFFNVFEKQIYADSFHYGFGMREKKDSWFNIEERMTSKVAGLMLKMKNDKILKIIDNVQNGTEDEIGGPVKGYADEKWDMYRASSSTGAHDIVSFDAAKTVEDSIQSLEDYQGDVIHTMGRLVHRWYNRNTQGRNVTSVGSTLPASKRTGSFEWNDGTYYIENALAKQNNIYTIVKDAWCDHYIGPEVDVAYKDRMKPSNWEGRIMFHFNGLQVKLPNAIIRKEVIT